MVQTQAYLLTLAIGVPLVMGAAFLGGQAPGRRCRVAEVAICASCLTHPLLWLAIVVNLSYFGLGLLL